MQVKTIGTVLFMAVLAGIVYLWSNGAGNNALQLIKPAGNAPSASVPVAVSPAASPDAVKMGDVRAFNQQSESVALARSMYTDLNNLATKVETRLTELRRQRDTWNTQIRGLLTNEDGLFISADQADVSAFRAHFENVPSMPDEEIEGYQESLDAIMEPIKSALQGQTVTGTPNTEFAPRIKSLDAQIKDAEKPFRESIPAIEAILTAAKDRGQRGGQKLQEVLDEMTQAEAVTRAAKIEAARVKAEEEVTQQLAKAEADRVLADGEKKRQEIESESQALRATAEADAIKARATNPDTLKRLEPFIAKGHSVLEANSRVYKWHKSETKKVSVSLKAISARRGLEESEFGLECLQGIANDYRNGRPGWPQPSTPEDWDWVRENQKLLRELGTTLVELGHLEP